MRSQKNNKISICLDNYYIYDFINEVLLYIYIYIKDIYLIMNLSLFNEKCSQESCII